MLGGGGIGVAGAELRRNQQSTQGSQVPGKDIFGFDLNFNGLNESLKELERRWLKDSEVIRNHQKKLLSKINAIEFFLGKKFDDYNRKDTMH